MPPASDVRTVERRSQHTVMSKSVHDKHVFVGSAVRTLGSPNWAANPSRQPQSNRLARIRSGERFFEERLSPA